MRLRIKNDKEFSSKMIKFNIKIGKNNFKNKFYSELCSFLIIFNKKFKNNFLHKELFPNIQNLKFFFNKKIYKKLCIKQNQMKK